MNTERRMKPWLTLVFAMPTYYLELGEYALGITCTEKATGTVQLLPCSIRELERQDAAQASV